MEIAISSITATLPVTVYNSAGTGVLTLSGMNSAYNVSGKLAFDNASIESGFGNTTDQAYLAFWTKPSGSGIAERVRISSTGAVGIGTNDPNATLDVEGAVKFGVSGSSFSAMGVCSTPSLTITNAPTGVTCTGLPASTKVAVSCSGANAFTSTATALYCRPGGVLNTMQCNTSLANSVSMIFTCLWIAP